MKYGDRPGGHDQEGGGDLPDGGDEGVGVSGLPIGGRGKTDNYG